LSIIDIRKKVIIDPSSKKSQKEELQSVHIKKKIGVLNSTIS